MRQFAFRKHVAVDEIAGPRPIQRLSTSLVVLPV
jgi:hypothetical protein